MLKKSTLTNIIHQLIQMQTFRPFRFWCTNDLKEENAVAVGSKKQRAGPQEARAWQCKTQPFAVQT